MGARIIFAGCDNPTTLELMRWAGAKSILLSYYYIRKRKNLDWHSLLKGFDWVMIDSGAHTFKAGAGIGAAMHKGQTKSAGHEIDPNDMEATNRYVYSYMDDYAEWVVKHKDVVSCYVEMDIDELVGKKQCDDYRDYMVSQGMPIEKMMTVFHSQEPAVDTLRDFEEWSEKYEYSCISFGGVNMGYIPLFNIARKYGHKIHGLATTNFSWIYKHPFFSVDSTSWMTGVQYGATFIYHNGRLKTYDKKKKSVRKRYKLFCEQRGIDYDGLMNDKSDAVNKFNLCQWVEWAEALDRNKIRDYWLKPRGVSVAVDEELDEALDAEFSEEDGAGILPEVVEEKPPILKAPEVVPNAFNDVALLSQPVLCEACYLGDRCPYYKENAECQAPVKLEIRNAKDMMALASKVIELQGERVFRQAFIEKMDGGQLDPMISQQMTMLLDMMNKTKNIFDTRDEVTIKAKGNGILQQIFGNIGKREE